MKEYLFEIKVRNIFIEACELIIKQLENINPFDPDMYEYYYEDDSKWFNEHRHLFIREFKNLLKDFNEKRFIDLLQQLKDFGELDFEVEKGHSFKVDYDL